MIAADFNAPGFLKEVFLTDDVFFDGLSETFPLVSREPPATLLLDEALPLETSPDSVEVVCYCVTEVEAAVDAESLAAYAMEPDISDKPAPIASSATAA